MKQKMKVEPTLTVEYKGRQIRVGLLSEELICEIETLDRLKQDVLDAAFALEKAQLAANMKALVINNSLQNELEPKPETQTVKVENGSENSKFEPDPS